MTVYMFVVVQLFYQYQLESSYFNDYSYDKLESDYKRIMRNSDRFGKKFKSKILEFALQETLFLIGQMENHEIELKKVLKFRTALGTLPENIILQKLKKEKITFKIQQYN
jgi:hypothetical protein